MVVEQKLSWIRRVVLLVSSSIVFATTAGAAPLDVFFTGSSIPSDPMTSYGISEADAFAARDDFGIAIVDDAAFIGLVTGTLDPNPSFAPITTQEAFDGVESRATSSWTVDNVSDFDLAGATYLLFTHTDPYEIDGTMIDYADANVGLTIDADLGWVIVKASDPQLGDFYYPAILLDRSVVNPLDGTLTSGGTSSAFDVSYVVTEALTEAPPGSELFHLPELQLGMAHTGLTVVPEPRSAALLLLGLAGLATRRRD